MHTGTSWGSIMHPAPDLTNATVLHGIVEPCENQGIDTSVNTAALQHGDIDSVTSWVRAFFTVH